MVHDIKFKINEKTYLFPMSSVPYMEKALEEINKKRDRLVNRGRIPEDFPTIQISTTEIDKDFGVGLVKQMKENIPSSKLANFVTNMDKYCVVKFNYGEAPVLNNWKVLGIIEKNPETENYTVSSFNEKSPIPTAYRDVNPTNCDHCGTNRKRNSTFIIQNTETNEIQQVGKSCMKDFVDEKQLEALMFHADFKDIVSDWMESDMERREALVEMYPKKEYLAVISAYMRHENGYRSYKNANFWDNAPHTSMVAKHYINKSDMSMYLEYQRSIASKSRYESEKRAMLNIIDRYSEMVYSLDVTEEDYIRAEKTIKYFQDNPPKDDDNEFYFNMHSILTNDSIFLYKGESGRASYAIEYYDKDMKAKLKKSIEQQKENNSVSVPDFIGDEDTKIESIELSLKSFYETSGSIFGYYGEQSVYYNNYVMETHDGRTVTWRASNNGRPDCFSDYDKYPSDDSIKLKIKSAVDSGQPLWVTFKGNVSGYYTSEKDGSKRTNINRCNSISELSDTPKTNGVIHLKGKYTSAQFQVDSIERGVSKASNMPQYKYNVKSANGSEYFFISYDKIKDVKEGDFIEAAVQPVGKEVFGLEPSRAMKIEGFDPEFTPTLMTPLKASKYGLPKTTKTKTKTKKIKNEQ